MEAAVIASLIAGLAGLGTALLTMYRQEQLARQQQLGAKELEGFKFRLQEEARSRRANAMRRLNSNSIPNPCLRRPRTFSPEYGIFASGASLPCTLTHKTNSAVESLSCPRFTDSRSTGGL